MEPEPNDDRQQIAHREFDTDQRDPNVAVVQTIAELEGEDTDELSPLYTCLDNILEHLFSNPPDPTARAQITFSYQGYQITIHQDGTAKFVES